MMRGAHSRLEWMAGILAIWILCVACYAAFSVNSSLKRAEGELNETGFLLHRMISQRVAQHDAHLTTLVSLVLAAEDGQSQPLTQVGESIMRFYPRITAINELEITWREPSASAEARRILSIPADARVPDDRSLAAAVFMQKAGEGKSYVDASSSAGYLLTKKVRDSNPAPALVLQIDPKRLVDIDELPDWVFLQLQLDGRVVMERPAGEKASGWLAPLRFSRMIDSQSQPLLLTVERRVSLADLVDVATLAMVAAASLGGIALFGYSLRHRREARLLQAAAERAEQRSILLAREARLAHAARVNSLGELASGIAHELAQPLTALMSQSRAAERLLEQSGMDNPLLKKTMAANVREARRAGDMLKRMRDYISNRPPKPVAVEINKIVGDTVDLMHADLEQRGIALDLSLAGNLPVLMADPVELEQVLNNLIRNAAESLVEAGIEQGRVTIATMLEGDRVRIDIRDNGPGIKEALLPRLFEPFFTTKPDGMGLGLALCSTLVERVGGQIEARNELDGGACFTVRLTVASEEASR